VAEQAGIPTFLSPYTQKYASSDKKARKISRPVELDRTMTEMHVVSGLIASAYKNMGAWRKK
jgi:hypothetical protein